MKTNEKVNQYVQILKHDRDFVDYVRSEIHDIIKEGRVDLSDIQNIVSIVVYIIKYEYKQELPKDILGDIIEAFVIEILQRYGVSLSPEQYEQILTSVESCIKRIFQGKPCVTQPKKKSSVYRNWWF